MWDGYVSNAYTPTNSLPPNTNVLVYRVVFLNIYVIYVYTPCLSISLPKLGLRKHILLIEPLDKLGTMCHSMKLYEMVVLLLSYSHQ